MNERARQAGCFSAVVLAATATVLSLSTEESPLPRSVERDSSTSLRSIARAQEDYYRNDRDGNGRKEYRRADIAGLHTVSHAQVPGDAIKLIELSVASADARPETDVTPYTEISPKAGYWFAALRHADELELQSDRFAACAFPAIYGKTGRLTYIIDETGTVYAKDLGHGQGIDHYPRDPAVVGWNPRR